MKVKRLILLIIFLPIIASCLSKNVDKELATNIAISYFTVDYQNLEKWLESFQSDTYYSNFLEKEALPVLGPYFAEHKVQSTAKLQSIDEYYRKDVGNNENVKIWKIILEITPPWPSDGPPYPFNTGAAQNIPWSEDGQATVYVATYDNDTRDVILISPLDIDRIIEIFSR